MRFKIFTLSAVLLFALPAMIVLGQTFNQPSNNDDAQRDAIKAAQEEVDRTQAMLDASIKLTAASGQY